MFKFWRETSSWADINFEKGMDIYYSELRNYVVLVRGIPRNLNPDSESTAIKRILKRTYQNQLIDFKIVGEYSELNRLGEKWKE